MLSVELDPLTWLPDNGPARLIGLVFLLLIGYQGRGFIVALLEDRRTGKKTDIDLLEEIKKITKAEMTEMRTEIDALRQRNRRLENRVRLLENTLHANHITIPPES